MHVIKEYGGGGGADGGLAPLITNLDTTWSWALSLTIRSLYPHEAYMSNIFEKPLSSYIYIYLFITVYLICCQYRVLRTIEWWCDTWIMKWKGYEREWSWSTSFYSGICPEGLSKTTKSLERIVGVQTRFEPGTSHTQVRRVTASTNSLAVISFALSGHWVLFVAILHVVSIWVTGL
jgi:hypothetical protein